MLKQYYSLLIIWFFIVVPLQAQIKTYLLETYYIADSDDLTNTTGGQLPEGSKTYRIFVEMESGSKMVKMYGDQNHPLVFSSSLPFLQQFEGGVSLAYELSKARLKDNTVALIAGLLWDKSQKPDPVHCRSTKEIWIPMVPNRWQ
ncbi:MAG: hypothetical protein IPL63_12415 [Saprospiraceae bacterium]|nr:hypothetical protein [Saprospiraceae bacterium]